MAIVVDTGVLLAVINATDRFHRPCVELVARRRPEMIIPAAVIVETAWLVGRELGNAAEAAFVAAIGRGEFRVEDLQGADYQRAAELLVTYEDSRLGLVDTCVMAIAERLHAVEIATVNPRDFRIVRPRHCDAFTILP